MIVHAAESLYRYWFNTIEPPYSIWVFRTTLDSRCTTVTCRKTETVCCCMKGTIINRHYQYFIHSVKLSSHVQDCRGSPRGRRYMYRPHSSASCVPELPQLDIGRWSLGLRCHLLRILVTPGKGNAALFLIHWKVLYIVTSCKRSHTW